MPERNATSALYAAEPVVKINGNVERPLSAALTALCVTEDTDGLSRCELSVGNLGADSSGIAYVYFNRSLIDFGGELEVRVGDGDAAATVFQGIVTGIEGRYPLDRPPELVVLAEDALQELRLTRRTRTFEDSSDEDVFAAVASDHALQPRIDIDGNASHRVIVQANQSDLAFLRERAAAIDAELWIEGGALHVQSRSRREADTIELTYGHRLREFSVLADLSHQYPKTVVSGWDVQAKAAIAAEADAGSLGSELGRGHESGGDLAERVFGPRTRTLVHTVPRNEEEASLAAEASHRRHARSFVRGRGVCEGDGRIRVGARVQLAGIGPMFGGTYYVCEATHAFDRTRGYRTHFGVERMGVGR